MVLVLAAVVASSAAAQQPVPKPTAAPSDTPQVRRRPRSVEYSDAYYTRLTIHRIGSYTMLPLVASEWYLGNRLLNGGDVPSWTKSTHVGVATAIGVLFTVNTVTGAWNAWDSRHDPSGRTRRYLHTGLMLAADAGFAWAGLVADEAGHGGDDARRHRDIALASIGVSTVGTALMWFWKN
jgi:hypothetical protein